MKPEVIYCDNHCLVTVKPAGMPSQADRTGDRTVLDWARDWVQKARGKPGTVYLGLVHRLDRPAAGLLLLARTSKAASRLSEQFRQGRVGKTYLVVVTGDPGPEGELRHRLRKDPRLNRSFAVGAGRAGREARLRYTTVGHAGPFRLLRVDLLTGRPHQIRAQFSAEGCPVVGDLKYGAARPLSGRRIALYSHRLAFDHPTRGKRLAFEMLPPGEMFPWNRFPEMYPPAPVSGSPLS